MTASSRYRSALPQLGGGLFLTDGGLETTLVFHEGMALPDFAAFVLLRTAEGESLLRSYFERYAAIAKRHESGLILESATWRANSDWAARLGYSSRELAEANRRAIRLLEEVRDRYDSPRTPVVVSGCVGPRYDGYVPDRSMSAEDAERYHREQIEVFAGTSADMVCALTLNRAEEAVGIARAGRGAAMPVAVSFTVETDGRLPTGQTLGDAINQVDDATSGYAVYYMVNCAHPSHFREALPSGEPWLERLRGLRANASRLSHSELNEATDLDAGDPEELGQEYMALKRHNLKQLNVLGGCCGTDHRHVDRIGSACLPAFRNAG